MNMKYSILRNVKMFFDVITDDAMKEEFKLLKALHSRMRTLKRKTPEFDALSSEIKTLRGSLKTKAQGQYRIRIDSGRYYNEQIYAELPNYLGFKETVDSFIDDIRSIRKELAIIKTERHSNMGFNYQMMGNVFQKSGTILDIAKNVNHLQRIRTAKAPHAKQKSNYVGFELEMMCMMNRNQLEEAFIKEKLSGYVHIKSDSSIRVESDSEQSHEVTVLCRQEEIESVITRICKVLNSKACSAKVNNSCGFHLHIDMRNRDAYKSYNNLVRILPMLNRMVPEIRVSGTEARQYCQTNRTADLKEYYPDPTNVHSSGVARESRYQAINPRAYSQYSTLEVRLHSGTTNARKIIQWANICVAACDADWLTQQVSDVDTFSSMVMRDSKTLEYIRERITLFETKKGQIDTRADYVLDSLNGSVA